MTPCLDVEHQVEPQHAEEKAGSGGGKRAHAAESVTFGER
jgi:hypothetical protein